MATAVEPEVTETTEVETPAPAAVETPPPDEPKKTLTAPEDSKPAESAVPDKYELKLPDDSALAESDLEELAAKARSQGLNQDQAQALVDVANETAVKKFAAWQESVAPQGAAWRKVVERFESEAKADPQLHPSPEGFTQNIETAKTVLMKYGGTVGENKPLYDALEETGYGSHPAFLKFLLNVAKATSEGEVIPAGNRPTKVKPDAEVMYDHPDNHKYDSQESTT